MRIHAIAPVDRQENIIPRALQYNAHKFIIIHVIFNDQDASLAHWGLIYRVSSIRAMTYTMPVWV